jgi:hypothetical protein
VANPYIDLAHIKNGTKTGIGVSKVGVLLLGHIQMNSHHYGLLTFAGFAVNS